MSTLALDSATTPQKRGGASAVLRNFDLVILVAALPIFVFGDLPILGYAVAAAAWVAQRLLFELAQRRSRRALAEGDRRTALGLTAGSTLGRLWLVTISILLVGLLGSRDDGLAAAVLSAILVTAFLVTQAITHLPEQPASERGEA